MSSSPRSFTPRFALTIRKLLLSFFVVFTFIAYAIRNQMDVADVNAKNLPTSLPQVAKQSDSLVVSKVTQVPTNVPPTAVPTNVLAPATVIPVLPTNVPLLVLTALPLPTATPLPAPTATPQGQYKDGTYNGPVVDAFYGNVQVEAVIQGGKLTDVQFLDYPHDRRTSRFINQQAMPWLTQEAVQVQSANVDLISGATFTSEGFVQSLQSALDQAHT